MVYSEYSYFAPSATVREHPQVRAPTHRPCSMQPPATVHRVPPPTPLPLLLSGGVAIKAIAVPDAQAASSAPGKLLPSSGTDCPVRGRPTTYHPIRRLCFLRFSEAFDSRLRVDTASLAPS